MPCGYKHINKTDTYAMTHGTDVGYDLQTSLVVSDQTGQPLAPVAQPLVSVDGSYATYGEPGSGLPVKHHLDEVSDCIPFLDGQGFAKPLVHLIDREADSVGHIRRWEAANSHWLVRCQGQSQGVDYQGKPMACKAVAQELAFSKARQGSHHGQTYWQWVRNRRDTNPSRQTQPEDGQKADSARHFCGGKAGAQPHLVRRW